ncbi:mucoidy inhibitor MuiA family protein [Ereboglobus luteus]|uniref:Mucoidy inhibitor MuiA family protein n=1 Tax=Ereboglobus luteus TaxID=1796921 RepID=A0A2U8E4K2_9BACT|nr:mucoidy inhibitor MuiA family protein [Ereboglobus luteus]AWI09793.1 hypothetical protein CKA38_11515 [Ereboglobus luteus]
MKTSTIGAAACRALFIAAMFCSPVLALAQDTRTPSKITAVTVYTDRAIVTRTASVELSAGESCIALEKLPVDLVDASVQVRGRGTAAATILDVTTAITHTDKVDATSQPRVKTLQDELKAVDKTLRALNDRNTTLQWQVSLVGKIEDAIAAPPAKDAPASHPKIEDMQKLLDFSRENRAALAVEGQKLSDEINETQGRRVALQSQLNEILQGGSARKSYKTVTVRLNAAKSGSLDLTLDYTVHGASWTPAYDVRLRAEERVVELAYHGIVRQSSGEDWKNIALTLSTARPGLGGSAPEAKPWYVDVFVPKPAVDASSGSFNRTGAVSLGNSNALMLNTAAMDNRFNNDMAGNRYTFAANGDGYTGGRLTAAPALSVVTSDYAVAKVDNTTTSASFKIAAATSIPSDNTPQKVSITTAKLGAKLQYQSLPALQETAYLSAYVDNSTEFPLLAGSTNVFLDDAFVSTSSIKTVMPSERFQLSLGADEGVAIKRRVVNRFSETTGLTGKGRRVTYEFLVTITNKKKTVERVVFKESLPISRNEKIVLNVLAPAERDIGTVEKPGKEVTREENNTLVWRIDMKPGEKREIPVKFNIEYPGDIQVTGLE